MLIAKGDPIAAFTYDGYRPEWGKWIQRDPLGYLAGWNLYEYVGGEPGREFDPLGLAGWSWYEGWGTTLYYLAGGGTAKENKAVRDGFGQGMEDGAVMTYDVVTFGLDSEIHDEAERRYREGDWTYAGGRAFAMVGRTAALAAAFLPAGAWLAGTGAFGEGIVTVVTLGGAFGAGYQTGRGIGRVASGDKEGWWDVFEGALNSAIFFLPYKPTGKPGTVREVDVTELRYSQRTAGGRGRGQALRESMGRDGWKGDPIDAVESPDGVIAIDNTRPAIAKELGISQIPVRIHSPNEPLPAGMEGRFGNARTWGEALQYRLNKQIPPLSPTGTPNSPKVPSACGGQR